VNAPSSRHRCILPGIAQDPRWNEIARREPYFAIITDPRFLRSQFNAAARHDFFATGEALVEHIFHVAKHRLAPDFAPTAILDFGCGVGRLTIPLARRAAGRGGAVLGVDRSPEMLEISRGEAQSAGVANITFARANEIQPSQSFDLICCYLVFQHLAPDEVHALTGDLISHLVPGGVLVLHVPVRSRVSTVVSITRTLRSKVPFANALANTLKGNPPGRPFIQARAHSLVDIVDVAQRRGIGNFHLEFDRHEQLDTVMIYLERPWDEGRTAVRALAGAAPINTAALVHAHTLEELNASAERYFSSLTDPTHQLTKPFSSVTEAPALLADLAVVLDGLRLRPGDVIVDFGAGAGWLSRYLTQLGMKVVIVDVSASALRLARELYERQPVIGTRPQPEFLLFDGKRLQLDDASVHRILSFHAFHHVANGPDLLREFSRVLTPGGIAGFVEPGPHHSESSSSQFEMRSYGVVESDVDVHAIWRDARSCGFANIQVALFNATALTVSLTEFEDFLAGGVVTERWTSSTRRFLRNVRTFFLSNPGQEVIDSRTAVDLACTIQLSRDRVDLDEGAPLDVAIVVTNTGAARWLRHDAPYGGVMLAAHRCSASGELEQFSFAMFELSQPPRDVEPAQTVTVHATIAPQAPGEYWIEFDCVSEHVAWFATLGSSPARLRATWSPRSP